MIELVMAMLLLAAGGDRAQADALFEKGEWGKARTEYEALLEEAATPDADAELSDLIGRTILGEGGVWEAEKWFTRSIQARETAAARLHRGQVYVGAGARAARAPGVQGAEVLSLMNDGARDLERALELDPRFAEAWFTLGVCESYREGDEPAERAYRKALEFEPGHLGASLNLAAILERGGGADAAREILESVAEDGRDARVWTALARLAGKTGDGDREKEAWTRAVLAAPADAVTYDGLWRVTAVKKRFADFEKAMARVLEAHPDAYLAHYFLGFAYRYTGRPKEAIAAFTKTLEINPEEIQARVKIADILSEDLRDPDGSISHYLEALKSDPENERARVEVARLALNKAAGGDLDEAHRLFTVLREAQPNEPSHTANLALVEKELGRPERGVELYLEAEERFPFNARLANDRGLLLMGLGREDEAIAAFEKALNRDPEFLDALENLGAYSRLRGDRDAAVTRFRSAYDRVRAEGGDAGKFRRYLDKVARERE
jgi:superkiller protein 3